ncbi:MAG: RdgB/HAM1 family non-canonical purine NTP pyrophosphatase [Halobacteriota archaeon]
MTLRFVTGNEGKVREVEALLDAPVEQVAFDYVEPQTETLEAIAISGAVEAFAHLPGESPVIVEDSGLFIETLDGFPGPYSAFVEGTLGIERVWHLVETEVDRSARFESVVGFADGRSVHTFVGRVAGSIVAPRGTGGFGYDPIFEVDGRTFAERSIEDKNALSHRARAFEAFARWYADYDRGSASGPG